MSILDEFNQVFGRPRSSWTKAQWEQVAIELAARIDISTSKTSLRGRPRHNADTTTNGLIKDGQGKWVVPAQQNYQSLANQVKDRLQKSRANGQSMTIKQAVLVELKEAIRRHNTAKPEQRGERNSELRESRANEMLETAYTEVRKILRVWKKAEKK